MLNQRRHTPRGKTRPAHCPAASTPAASIHPPSHLSARPPGPFTFAGPTSCTVTTGSPPPAPTWSMAQPRSPSPSTTLTLEQRPSGRRVYRSRHSLACTSMPCAPAACYVALLPAPPASDHQEPSAHCVRAHVADSASSSAPAAGHGCCQRGHHCVPHLRTGGQRAPSSCTPPR